MSAGTALSDASILVRRADVLWRSAPNFLAITTVDGTTLQAEGPAAEVWRLLERPTAFDSLCAELAARHDIAVTQVRADLTPFIEHLITGGWIEHAVVGDE